MPYYQKSVNEIYKEYNTSINGLHEKEAKARLKKYGPNKITSEKKISILKLIFDQINDPLIWVLFFAIIISAIIQHYIDVIVIAIIILLNGIFGFTQEYKAEKAIEHLKKLQQHQIDVIRNGKEIRISTELIVPGDILCIEDGDKIPADCRLIETIELKIDEASLTGESHPVSKNINIISKKVSLGDQTNMIFAGTTVIRGRGKAIVVKTAKKTELGRIAKEIESIETEQTPLQKKLKEIGKWLTYIVIGICVSIFILGAIRGFDLVDMFIMSISLAVAAIPEGLPAVVTITLAIGLKKMLKRQALIRRLRSVETLGSVTVICSDKTGTLTKNEMTVTKVFSNFKDYTVTGSGYNDTGEINYKGKKINNDLNNLILTATTCNNASLILGDPTEKALKALAAKAKIEPKDRKSEIPFSSENKYMIVTDKNNITYLKGALEVVLKRCSLIEIDGKVRKLTPQDKKQILAKNIEYSKEALRVLAFAYGKKELIFLGLTGIMDPPREEVHKSITLCKQAGIRIIMITGDHKITAEAVAKQVGIVGKSINGLDLDKLSDKQLQKTVKTTSIYARVDSIHKARILKALQANGEIVAMTGDGVNDAPAIKQSDVGIAMNIKGTEISKDVSDLILLDDNFSTIVAAVEEGRTIYNNIKKFVKFLLAANFGEILLITIPILLGFKNLPIIAIQILWVNLVTDSFPALALGMDPHNPDVMNQKPRNPKESFFTNFKGFMIISAILCSIVTLGLFLWFSQDGDINKARTMTFTTLVMFELFLVFACRSDEVSIFKLKQNVYLYGAVLLSFLLQIILIYTPLSQYFQLTTITFREWLIILPLAASGLIFFELKKWIFPTKK